MRRNWLPRVVGLAVLMLVTHATLANSIRIMPLGDSDTGGAAPYLSYRYDLWFLLLEAGFNVDFVGRRHVTGVFDPNLYPRHEEMDPNHEGNRNNQISDMISAAPVLIQTNRPHVVLWKGSLDICFSGAAAAGIMRIRLPEMIDAMRAQDANLHFVLATSYDWWSNCEPDARTMIPDFNQAIADVAAAKDTPGSRVLLADHYTGFNIESMYDTNVFHANRQGEMFLAGRWFDALDNLLPTVETDGFSINAGLNDAWFNPDTAGQGFFITVYPDIEMMFLAWFTYDTVRPAGNVQANLGEPGHRWLTAFGQYAGNIAELDIELTSGGVFDAANPAPGSVPDGTIVVNFEGCNAATVDYDILSAGVTGEIPIERIALDNLAVCEALAE
jgi:hypothetical protein